MLYPKDNPRVSIVKIENENFYDALKKGISFLGFSSFPDGIAIKTNLCDLIPPDMGVTTDVRAIDALIKIIKESSNSKIKIVESDHWVASAEEEFNTMGYQELEKKHGVDLVNLSKDKKRSVKINGSYFKDLRCPQTLLENKLISVSKMKTHHQYRYTGILKNQFGLLPTRFKSKYHPYMSQVLSDLNGTFTPFLSIIEGLVSMEGAGPSEGKPIRTEIVICGTDPVAVDYIAAKTMGMNPLKIKYLKYAAKKGVGEYKNIEVFGDEVQYNFKFIPFPTFIFSRFAIGSLKIGQKIENFFKNISDRFDEAFVATITLRKGYHTSMNFGLVTPESIYKYAKSLLIRIGYKITHR